MALSKAAEDYLIEVRERFADDERFCAESLSVLDEQGQVVPFAWRPAQQRLDEAIKRQQERGKPVRLVILKTRRAGFSTGVAGKFFKETAFVPGQQTLVVAHEGRAVKESIFPMYRRFQEHYRPFGELIALPKLVSDRNDKLEWEIGSSIAVATANNLEASRSFGFRRVHLTEFAFYRNAKRLMLALMQTVPRDSDTMVIVESTANGIGDAFWELWQEANDPNKQSDWEPLFFGCYDDPQNWRELSVSPQAFQASLTKQERLLVQQFNLRLEQINWRRWCIANNCDGSEEKFNQEYPDTPERAFIVSGRPRFDHAAINRFRAEEGQRGELEVEEVAGHRYLRFYDRSDGRLQIFKRPDKGRHYIIGSDTAEGLDANEGKGKADPDYSVSQVFDRDTGEQVAILRGRLIETDFGEYNYNLAAWFNWAYVVPEVKGGYGRSMLDTMIRLGYPLERIYNRRNEAIPTKPRYEDLGWDTNTVTRPQLLSAVDRILREFSVTVRDAMTIQELRTFVYKPAKQEAQDGCHDDCVIALALAVIGIERAPRFKEQEQNAKRNQPTKYRDPLRDRISQAMK
jgi:hypothetical protein